jgi:hypothetical protein
MMNERIKEIWEEATVSVWPRPGKFTAGEYDYHIEKFAELIVRECSGIAQQHNKSPVAAPLAIGYVIREHFGVEE